MAQVAISTRLSERLQVRHPVICAPMDMIAGGKLAAAVSSAGGLGLQGGGYSDEEAWFACAASLAGVILERMVAEAEQILARGPMIAGAGS